MEAQKSLSEDVGLWALVGVALVLVLGLWGWQTFFLGQSQSSWLFRGVNTNQVNQIELVQDGLTAWKVTRKNEQWTVTNPADVRASGTAIDRLLDTLINVNPETEFEGQTTEDYGVANSYIQLNVSGKKHRLYFGAKRPSGSGRYVQYGKDGSKLFVLKERDYNELKQSLFKLRKKSLFEQSVKDVNRLTLVGKDESVTYKRTGGSWSIGNNGEASSLNDTNTETLKNDLQTFLFLSADDFYDTQPEQLGDKQAMVSFSSGESTVKVTLGSKDDDKRMLKRDGWPVVAVRQDPVSTFQDLPQLPENWPEVEEKPSPIPSSKKPGSMNGMKNMKLPGQGVSSK